MRLRNGSAGVCATALALGTPAWAGELSCEQRVDGAPVRAVTHYPATLHYRVTVTNSHPFEATEVLGVRAGLLEPQGLHFTPQAPFRLTVGQSAGADVTLPLQDEAACLALAAADGTVDRFIDTPVTVRWETGGAVCSARAVCGPLVAPPPPECPASAAATRSLGYWKTHVGAVAACLAHGGPLDVGLASLDTMGRVEGVLWGSPVKFADGTPRTGLDQKRFLLARALLVATCNVRVFGAQPPSPDLLREARGALAGTDCAALQTHTEALERFEDCGLARPGLVFNAPDPKTAQRIAVDPTAPSGAECGEGSGGR